jgi:hypothetical protein
VITGVSPIGAQVRTRVGIRLKPDSSAKTSVAFVRRAFFWALQEFVWVVAVPA